MQRADLESAGRAGDFSREFSLLAALASPCVVQVFDHGVASRQAFLSMEVLSGGNVAQRVGRLAVSDAIAILRHAACALAQVHRGGWVHRDVKPANLLLRADGSLALGDFGCARRQGELDRLAAGAVLGTPLYAAPEQSQGAPADPAADVYSLGILFHQLLTGKPPYSGMTLTELLCQHLMAPLPRLPREYGAWQPLLDAMLAKDPRGRLADGQAVLEHLQHARHDTMDPS
jgi:serine/threonine protein kinase